VLNSCEFARLDCAPRPCGNGTLSIADWVQTGRYVAGLDTPILVSDCSAAAGFTPAAARGANHPLGRRGNSVRARVVTNIAVEAGQTNSLPILLDAQGDETGITFSLHFDPTLLQFVSASLVGEATNAVLFLVNSNQVAEGRVGLFVGLNVGRTLPPGL